MTLVFSEADKRVKKIGFIVVVDLKVVIFSFCFSSSIVTLVISSERDQRKQAWYPAPMYPCDV